MPREEDGKCYSLVAHVHIFNVLSDVERAVFPYPNCSEISTEIERAFTYLLERAGKCDFPNSTLTKTVFSNVLHALRNFNALEILAVLERPGFD